MAKRATPTTRTEVNRSRKSITGPRPTEWRRKRTASELWAAVANVVATRMRSGVVTRRVT